MFGRSPLSLLIWSDACFFPRACSLDILSTTQDWEPIRYHRVSNCVRREREGRFSFFPMRTSTRPISPCALGCRLNPIIRNRNSTDGLIEVLTSLVDSFEWRVVLVSLGNPTSSSTPVRCRPKLIYFLLSMRFWGRWIRQAQTRAASSTKERRTSGTRPDWSLNWKWMNSRWKKDLKESKLISHSGTSYQNLSWCVDRKIRKRLSRTIQESPVGNEEHRTVPSPNPRGPFGSQTTGWPITASETSYVISIYSNSLMPFSYKEFRLKMTPYSLCYNERTQWQTIEGEWTASQSLSFGLVEMRFFWKLKWDDRTSERSDWKSSPFLRATWECELDSPYDTHSYSRDFSIRSGTHSLFQPFLPLG